MHAARFGVVGLEPPLPLTNFQLKAVAPKAVIMDAGLAWLFHLLTRLKLVAPRRQKNSPERNELS